MKLPGTPHAVGVLTLHQQVTHTARACHPRLRAACTGAACC